MGMVYAAKVSVAHQGLAQTDADRIEKLVKDLQLPAEAEGLEWSALRDAMTLDKKTASSIPRFVLAESIGTVVTKCEVGDEVLEECWRS
jgi:3-dehydroquinate synthetase